MKKVLALTLVCLLLCAPALAMDAASLISAMAAGDFQTVYDNSTDAMRAAIASTQTLAETWAQVELMYGKCGDVSPVDAPAGAPEASYVACDFENAVVTFAMTVTDGKMDGFVVAGVEAKSAPLDPRFAQEILPLREGEADQTDAHLVLPEGDGPFPCVLMLQGSGPSDKDELVYGLPIFGQLASGLAERGVASIRFDKYTFAHAALCGAPDFTVEGEYLSDAKAAAAYLEADPRISDVYVLGHSLGGMIAPRALTALNDLTKPRGAVMLCSSPRALWEIMARQYADMGVDQAIIDEALATAEQLPTMDREEILKTTLFGAQAYYFWDEGNFDEAGAILAMDCPVLLVQGGKDFQVKEFEGEDAWMDALGAYEKATYVNYPDMTHLLADFPGEASGTVADYAGDKEVSQTLMDDVAAWIKAGGQ